MTVLYQDAQGMQVRDFLEKFQDDLKGKHIIYVVMTNLAEDNLYRRGTRNEPHAIVFGNT